MTNIKGYFYYDGIKRIYLKTPKAVYEECDKCDGEGWLECDEDFDDCDGEYGDELCPYCGGNAEIELDTISKQRFFAEFYEYERSDVDAETIDALVELIADIDRQRARLKQRYGRTEVEHIRDFWVVSE